MSKTNGKVSKQPAIAHYYFNRLFKNPSLRNVYIPIPISYSLNYTFLSKLNGFNSTLSQTQINTKIQHTLNLFRMDKLDCIVVSYLYWIKYKQSIAS